MSSYQADFGVIYLVDENPAFQKMMRLSIKSLIKFHPDWQIHVFKTQSPPISLIRKIYRAISFWKWKERANRANQDIRVMITKPEYMLNSPFRHTLFMDVDTVLMRPLDRLLQQSQDYDVMVTAMPWKQYRGFQTWQPKTFRMINSGVMFYNENFKKTYSEYVKKLLPYAGKGFGKEDDQYMLSMTCYMEQNNLKICLEPTLQIDAMNVDQHLGTSEYPKKDGVLDLRYEGLKKFHIFHYNGPHKRQYIQQIKEVWGLDVDE